MHHISLPPVEQMATRAASETARVSQQVLSSRAEICGLGTSILFHLADRTQGTRMRISHWYREVVFFGVAPCFLAFMQGHFFPTAGQVRAEAVQA